MQGARAPVDGGTFPTRPATLALRVVYTLLLCVGLVFASPWLLLRIALWERYRRGLSERLALRLPLERGERERVWIHAASAGEMVAAASLARALTRVDPPLEVVLSSTTTSGVDVAARLFPEAARFVAPLDFGWMVTRVLRRIDPRALVLVELELWPNWMTATARHGMPVAVANGRISATTARRLAPRFARRFVGLDQVTAFAVQSDVMRDRLLELDVPADRIAVTGNMKVDVDRDGAPTRADVRRDLGLDPSDFVVLAGSTHPGEEGMVARAAARLAASGPIRLVVAPRHKERLADAEAELAEAGFEPVRLTTLRGERRPLDERSVVVVDTMGELGDLFAAADVGFVGGSLIDGVGGHNVFEPVLAGVPVLVGPHHGNVRGDVQFLEAASALEVVDDERALERAVESIRTGGQEQRAEAAKAAVAQARGAARRTVDVVYERCLSAAPASSGGSGTLRS